MIYKEINFNDFQDAFFRMGRKDQFSYEGKKTLFRYLDDLSSDQGEDIELDVISLCCDWAEYTEDELMKEYGEHNQIESFEELKEWINDRTIMLETENDSFLVYIF